MHARPQNSLLLTSVIALAVCAACGPAPAPSATGADNATVTTTDAARRSGARITGTVTYRERIALSPTAQLNVQLQDISRADVAATIIAEQDLTDIGQIPVSFALEYDPALIDERNTYALRATIFDNGQMLFTTDTVYPVITRGSGTNAEIALVRVTPAAATQAAALTDTNWELVAVSGTAIPALAGQRAPFLRLQSEGNVAQGFSGCNQFNGTWKINDGVIELGPMAMTMMACADGMETETAFMRALEGTVDHKIQGNELRLYRGDDEILLFRVSEQP